ncbi:hypothetical protein [Paenibacillus dendritiformis]
MTTRLVSIVTAINALSHFFQVDLLWIIMLLLPSYRFVILDERRSPIG